MKNLVQILAGGALLIGLATCTNCETSMKEFSEEIREDAIVATVVNTPQVYGPGGEPVDTVTVPRRYGVVFNLQNGNGTVDFIGRTQNHRQLAERFNKKEGHSSELTYQKIYWVTYRDTTGDGEAEVISREHRNNHFVSADLKQNDRE